MHAYCTRFLVVIYELLCRCRAREVHHATKNLRVADFLLLFWYGMTHIPSYEGHRAFIPCWCIPEH